MNFDVITLFPEMFRGPLSESILKRAQERNLISINYHQLRDWGLGKHKQVDDTVYGGGAGMLLRPDVVVPAIETVKEMGKEGMRQRVILLTPQGSRFNQAKARRLAKYDRLILVCGHYEGFDERICQFVDEQISIGDYILTGGELPAMVLIDSISRLIPGVLPEDVTDCESFSPGLKVKSGRRGANIEFPQYTKPVEFRGLRVPAVLLSGNHAAIEKWKTERVSERSDLKKQSQSEGIR